MRPGRIGPLVGAVLIAGCGSAHRGSSTTSPASTHPHRRPIAEQVCAAVRRRAAAASGHPATLRITSHDPADLSCRVTVGPVRLAVVAQASAQAWVEFDTTQVHQVQAYNAGSIHQPAQDPVIVKAHGALAMWIPAQREVFATNGTQTRGGSYVTVTASRGLSPARSRALARAVTLAALAVAPRGPAPG
jgi:hypothetical protein